jgi:nucleotide-binding universal stress UspA family protein
MRVLVPLDGTDLAASILPDARRVAGLDGELVLIRDATIHEAVLLGFLEQHLALETARSYLDTVAQTLRAEGVSVHVRPLVMGDAAAAIEEAAKILQVDMIACATHGRGPLGRLWWGSVAWRALVSSPVPVLLRHAETRQDAGGLERAAETRIMVPLDGSSLAETALPLAQELAAQWHATIWLVHVVPDAWTAPVAIYEGPTAPAPSDESDIRRDMQRYLQGIARGMDGEVRADIVTGPTVDALAGTVDERSITDIVMASHGRSGLSRVILGSVADALIHRLHLPIVVVPALAAQ